MVARRHADKHFREGMTMGETELSVEELKVGTGEPSFVLMLSRMKLEKPPEGVLEVRQVHHCEGTRSRAWRLPINELVIVSSSRVALAFSCDIDDLRTAPQDRPYLRQAP